jgi:hypothetical protein
MRLAVIALGVLAALCTDCRGKPRPVYEWEPTVTTTSGDAPAEETPPTAKETPPTAEETPPTAKETPPTTVPARPSSWLRGEKR